MIGRKPNNSLGALLGSSSSGLYAEQAMMWLEKAIKRHGRHMDGTESTSAVSQQTMMDEMMKAMDALKKIT